MSWDTSSGLSLQAWTITSGASNATWGGSAASEAGWLPLSVQSSPLLDIGVGFSVVASDFHGAYAHDDFRGFAAHDSSLSPPP